MEYVWLTVALLILVLLVRRPFQKGVLGALDARAERIRRELEEARRLHEEAKAALEGYRRQLEGGEALAREIAERGAAERERMEARLRAEFDALVERRTRQAEERIAQEEARAVAEVRGRAAGLAVRATRTILEERLAAGDARRVMRQAVGEVARKLG